MADTATAEPTAADDGRVKTWLALGFIFTLAWLPAGAWDALIMAALALWFVIGWKRIGLWMIWRRSLIAWPFALAALTLAIARPGAPVFQFTIGGQAITATDAGMVAAATVMAKSWLSVQAMLTLIATTHFSELLTALAALRLPPVLILILGMAYRYLFILQEEALRMLRARDSRSASIPGQPAGRNLFWRATITGRMVGTLFIRAYERSERIYAAMLARGYDGRPVTATQPPLRPTDYFALIGGGIVCVSLIVIAYI
ncbi:cobalt ABC transporter permease [Chloroflexus islandicus]|uniref:Cobalt ABC transporter permease n=1 Tax=Chloroflexus islandicus TaxID=1707952 RepID=A0A178MAI3_9CHLR|nr:cobalt ECF transporter T component CbiQ [Chloroflexus islandicus]OAN44884.1 cobalt ABC transporter permease [Chloroflexus islandicus]